MTRKRRRKEVHLDALLHRLDEELEQKGKDVIERNSRMSDEERKRVAERDTELLFGRE